MPERKRTPGNPVSRKYLADMLGLQMLVDISARRYPTQFIVADTLPKDHVRFLPKAHWKVVR